MTSTLPAVPASSPNPDLVTLSRDDLALLLEQAAARGASQVLARQQAEYLNMAQAAAYLYGRPDRVEAFRALRLRYPEIDTLSSGDGRFRRWKRHELDSWLATKPRFSQRAERNRQGVLPM